MSIKIVTAEEYYKVKRRSKLNPVSMDCIPDNPTGKPLYKKNKKAQQEYINMVNNIEYKRQLEARLTE